MGPLIFNLYVADLPSCIPGASCHQYADDTTIYGHCKPADILSVLSDISESIHDVDSWSKNANLVLNPSKTKALLSSTSQLANVHQLENIRMQISINDVTIEHVNLLIILNIYLYLSSFSRDLSHSTPTDLNCKTLHVSHLLSNPHSNQYSRLNISRRSAFTKPLSSDMKLFRGLQVAMNFSISIILISLSNDIATNPGPNNNQYLHCLSFNAQSIRSTRKLQDGTCASNLRSFQDLVYAEELDLVLVTETWLNANCTGNEILPNGYNIIRKDRLVNQRGGGVLIALRDNISYNRLTAGKNSPSWSDRLELIAIELEMANSKKALFCVCYRLPSCDINEWLELFTSFLETTSHYDKVFITGDFNFPDLTWNSTRVSFSPERSSSAGSAEFKELTFDFFLHQINTWPTKLNNILDLVLTTTPENIVNLSCISPATMDISSDHHLLFFDILLNLKSNGYDKRTVFDFHQVDWDSLHETLNHLDLSPDITSDDINADCLQWKGLFLSAAAKHIPQKSFKRRSTPPWFDGEVKHLLNRKKLVPMKC